MMMKLMMLVLYVLGCWWYLVELGGGLLLLFEVSVVRWCGDDECDSIGWDGIGWNSFVVKRKGKLMGVVTIG